MIFLFFFSHLFSFLQNKIKKVLAEIQVANVKSVVWSGSDNDSLAALISRDSIVIVNRFSLFFLSSPLFPFLIFFLFFFFFFFFI